MIRKPRQVRNEYSFARPLDESEADLLVAAIRWRKGSGLMRNGSGQVIACIAHPDDMGEFRKQLHARGARIGIRQSGRLISREEFVQRMAEVANTFLPGDRK